MKEKELGKEGGQKVVRSVCRGVTVGVQEWICL